MHKTRISSPKLVLDARADLGEGPAWEARSGCLDWVDIHAGRMHIFNPADGSDRSIDVGEYLGCAAPRRSGGWVLGLRSGFALLDSPLPYEGTGKMSVLGDADAQNTHFSNTSPFPLQGEGAGGRGSSLSKGEGSEDELKVLHILNPEPHLPGNRFNDGKCDPAGRFLAGSMDDTEVKPSGALYSLAPGGTLQTLITGTSTSNGLAWSPDYKIFYYIDTPTRTVMQYDYDLSTGGIAAPRLAISVSPELGWPDGMTSDSEGMLWVALWGGAKLTRWNPANGQLLAEIPFPVLNVSSCTFGGPDLTDLYVTSARAGMTNEQLANYPLSGGLFRIRTDIIGMPTFEFGG